MPLLPSIETSQLICSANLLTGFYMRATLAFNRLNAYLIDEPSLKLIFLANKKQRAKTHATCNNCFILDLLFSKFTCMTYFLLLKDVILLVFKMMIGTLTIEKTTENAAKVFEHLSKSLFCWFFLNEIKKII